MPPAACPATIPHFPPQATTRCTPTPSRTAASRSGCRCGPAGGMQLGCSANWPHGSFCLHKPLPATHQSPRNHPTQLAGGPQPGRRGLRAVVHAGPHTRRAHRGACSRQLIRAEGTLHAVQQYAAQPVPATSAHSACAAAPPPAHRRSAGLAGDACGGAQLPPEALGLLHPG